MAISVRWSLIVYGLTKAARLGTMIIRVTAWCSLALIANSYLDPYLNRRYLGSKFEVVLPWYTRHRHRHRHYYSRPYIILLLC